ncbi:MAG: hypothetical protein WD267_05660 [Balneolales bacterium]
MGSLEHAITIATKAHAGQIDKAGAPYILQPLRVMLIFTQRDEQITAVLHDVVEDSDWTLDGLRKEGFSEQVIVAVDALTRQPIESYEDFLERASDNAIAKKVKLADFPKQHQAGLNRLEKTIFWL